MFFKIRKKKNNLSDLLTIDDLKQKLVEKVITSSDRKMFKILFIDDEGYDIETLKSLGYIDISKKYKYENMDDLLPYHIIFCDISGIAEEIDPVFQGAALAKIIKNTYPEKIVIIFSAKNQSIEINQFYEHVDDIISKNISPSEMAIKIDEYIKMSKDPLSFWYAMRKKLIKLQTNSKLVAELEHYYVSSILNNEDNSSIIRSKETEFASEFFSLAINAIVKALATFMLSKFVG